MPFNTDHKYLVDINHNIHLAREFVNDMDFDEFRDSFLHYYAATRALEIISESSRRLSDDLKSRHSQIPWRLIAGSGNIFRHDYDDVLEASVWKTIHDDFVPLAAAIETELKTLRSAQ